MKTARLGVLAAIVAGWLVSAGCAADLEGKCQQLKPGMTVQEVKAIMGEPWSLDSTNAMWVYGQGERRVVLHFSSPTPAQPQQVLKEVGQPFTPRTPRSE
jgi:hypothetical protein